MSLQSGTQLGPYEILSQIGAGGMGEVYKARDTRLERFVAIKVLPADLADNPELRERFEREARTIAKLNHPHICTLFDIGHQDGTDYLVMEYLEGETLAERLKKGPLPLDQVLRYAVEVSDVLDKAHRAGVTHRDIKPGNIIVTKEGTKLLDFGLAKLKQEVANATIPASEMPTVPGALTEHGTLLGTLHYMAPEQVEGKVNEIDARTDIFAFGALVYEMATGKRAFPGETQASVIAKILEVDPPPMPELQPMTPQVLDRVVKRCLRKEPDRRWQTASDLKEELQWITEGGGQAEFSPPLPTRRNLRERVAWATAAVVILLAAPALVITFLRRAPKEDQPVRFSIAAPGNTRFVSAPALLAVSPDGSNLVFVAEDSSGTRQLWIRSLDSLVAELLPGTDNAFQPFWSPDSRFVAFYADGNLKRVDTSGGPPQTLVAAAIAGGRQGTWSREGVILFAPRDAPMVIQRVSAAGGPATAATSLDAARQEIYHAWPHFLPDGRHFLYFARSTNPENNAVYLASLDSNERTLLLGVSSMAVYAPPGYLLFQRESTLMAQPFDADRLELSDEPFPIAEGVQFNVFNGRGAFSVSENGVLAYRVGDTRERQLTWVDRTGKTLSLAGETGNYRQISLSPDETRVAVERVDPQTGGADIWVLEISRNIFSRLTFDPANETDPVWSPDSQQVAFTLPRSEKWGIYRKALSGAEELLFESEEPMWAEDWSRDDQFLLYGWPFPSTKFSLLPLSGDRNPRLVLDTPFRKDDPKISPDGRWLAYLSEELGTPEIFVQPVQGPGERLRISPEGGAQPRWRRDGRELFYLSSEGAMMSVPIQAGTTLEPGVPQKLFQSGVSMIPGLDQYTVTADGQRFLLILLPVDQAAVPITVVLNWFEELKQRVPVQ